MITHFTRSLRNELRARLGALRLKLGSIRSKPKEETVPKAVYKSGDKEYVIRDADRIWLARMIAGETVGVPTQREMQAILWALMNRFMLVPAHRTKESLAEMARAFSQPINPRWDGIPDNQAGQDFCSGGGRYEGTDYCSPSRLKRRTDVTALAWDDIHPTIREAVIKFERGLLPYPQRVAGQRLTNWASYAGVEEKFPWGVSIGGNWFFEDRAALKNLEVAIAGRRVGTLGTMAGLLAIGGAAAALGSYLAGRV